MYGVWQEDVQDWVYVYECLYDVNPDVDDPVLMYDAEDVVWEGNSNYVYGWRRMEFDTIEEARLHVFNLKDVVKEI